MAQIDHVDYEAMPRQAKQMREYAIELNGEIRTAYSNVGEMHNSWYGIRYNELVKDFNELVPQVNDLLKLVVTDIPFAVETIANNYAQADKGQNVTSAEETAANKIENGRNINSNTQSTQNSRNFLASCIYTKTWFRNSLKTCDNFFVLVCTVF